MKLELTHIIRKNILAMQPYSSARSLTTKGRIFLDANEAPEAYSSNDRLNRYPEPQPSDLRGLLGSYYDIQPNQICMGRGSDEAIDLLVRLVCESGTDAVLSCPPTYGMYDVAADLQGALKRHVPMQLRQNQFQLDYPGIVTELKNPKIKLLFICRPNNPTGELISLDDVERLAQLAGNRRLLVIDEAYIEFAPAESAATLIAKYPNIVVLRTFSKAWAMAGVRFGVAITSPEIATLLEKIRAPYPISAPVRDVVVSQLQPSGIQSMEARVKQIVADRESLQARLEELRSVDTVFPSNSNFLLVRVPDAHQSVFSYLRECGIVLCDRSNLPLLNSCIRITVGSAAENRALIDSWRTWENTHYA